MKPFAPNPTKQIPFGIADKDFIRRQHTMATDPTAGNQTGDQDLAQMEKYKLHLQAINKRLALTKDISELESKNVEIVKKIQGSLDVDFNRAGDQLKKGKPEADVKLVNQDLDSILAKVSPRRGGIA